MRMEMIKKYLYKTLIQSDLPVCFSYMLSIHTEVKSLELVTKSQS